MTDSPTIWRMTEAHYNAQAHRPSIPRLGIHWAKWSELPQDMKDEKYDQMRAAMGELRNFGPEMYDAVTNTGLMWNELSSARVWAAIMNKLMEIK